MTGYDRERIRREIAALDEPAPNTTTKGRRLQDLMHYLFAELPGVAVMVKNHVNLARSEEIDLWLRHAHSGLPFRDPFVPVECKNEDSRVGAAEIREFEAKIRNSGGCDGIMVANAGLAGTPGKSAHDAVKMALSRGVLIVVLIGDDLLGVAYPQQVVDLLHERSIELRLNQGYQTI